MNLVQAEVGRCAVSLHVQSQQASQILLRLMKVTALVRAEQGGNKKLQGEQKLSSKVTEKCKENNLDNKTVDKVDLPVKIISNTNFVEAVDFAIEVVERNRACCQEEIGKFVGKHFENFEYIRKQSGADISVNSNVITIKGEKSCVDKAVAVLES